MILYLAITWRPDLAFVAHDLSRHASDPGETHWKAALHVLSYLKRTADYALFIPHRAAGEKIQPVGYVDANFADPVDRGYSVTSYILSVGDFPIQWKTTKQSKVATSPPHAEVLAMGEVADECVLLKALFEFLRLEFKPVLVYGDSEVGQKTCDPSAFTKRQRYLLVNCTKAREENGSSVIWKFKRSEENYADLGTKNKSRHAYTAFLKKFLKRIPTKYLEKLKTP